MATVFPVPPAVQLDRPWYYSLTPTDDRMSAELAAELDAIALEAEADETAMSARADEAGDELLGLDEPFVLLWPREPDYLPAA